MNNEQNNYESEQQQQPHQQDNVGRITAAGRTVRNPNLPYKSAALATWLSLFPGMGQAYVGYYQLGFTYVMIMALTILTLSHNVLAPFFGPMLAFFWIFNLIDANRRAHNYNRALDGLDKSETPPDFDMPSLKGNLPVGIILVIAGILILLDLNFDVSLEWIESWWPVGLIGLGGWLVFKGRQ